MSALTVTGPLAIRPRRVRGSRGSSHGLPSLDEGSEPTRMKLSGSIPTPAVVAFGWVRWIPGRHIPWRSGEAGEKPREWTRWGNALQM